MSRENIEGVRRAFEAFAEGGREALAEFWDPEIELWLPPDLAQAGTYRGHAEVLGWMREWAEAWEEIDYTPEEFIEGGDGIVVGVLYDGRGRGSGVRVKRTFWFVMQFRDGKLWRWQVHEDRARALEAAGLSE